MCRHWGQTAYPHQVGHMCAVSGLWSSSPLRDCRAVRVRQPLLLRMKCGTSGSPEEHRSVLRTGVVAILRVTERKISARRDRVGLPFPGDVEKRATCRLAPFRNSAAFLYMDNILGGLRTPERTGAWAWGWRSGTFSG